MTDARFVEYFQEWKAKGYSEEQIKSFLTKKGYSSKIVDDAADAARLAAPKNNFTTSNTNNSSTMKQSNESVSRPSITPMPKLLRRPIAIAFMAVIVIIIIFAYFFFSNNITQHNSNDVSETLIDDNANSGNQPLNTSELNVSNDKTNSEFPNTSIADNSAINIDLDNSNTEDITSDEGSSGGGGGGSTSKDDLSDEIIDTPVSQPTCTDGEMNGAETGLDCGGDCNACESHSYCTADSECITGEYCAHNVCLLTVTGNTYFVATNGSDNNSGTFDQPFYSWQKAAEVSYPGDITYIRGGVWYPTTYIRSSSIIGMSIDPTGYTPGLRGGEEGRPIRFYNYPGEQPILDGSNITTSITRWLGGISIGEVQYIYMKGLTVRNIHQSPPNFSHAKPYSEVFGIGSGGANHYFENMVVHDIDGRAYQHWSDAWNEDEAQYGLQWCIDTAASRGIDPSSCHYDAPLFASDNTTWVNCDAYNIYDRYAQEPGNAADGWKVETYASGVFKWIGCRAWNYADDGFDPHGSGTRIFDNCWAMSTLKYDDPQSSWDIEGNGFKTTGIAGGIPTLQDGESRVVFKDCIAAYNIGGRGTATGMIANLLSDEEGVYSTRPKFYNNFAYHNTQGFSGRQRGDLRNNIVFDSQGTGSIGERSELEFGGQTLPNQESNNTWRSIYPRAWGGSYPWWEYNPAYNVTAADFVSLDYNELTLPRKADGSLPDINFGHLAPGSDLIDGGTIIPGYHCDTAGAHPGQECKEWYGSAPDLGPFEYS